MRVSIDVADAKECTIIRIGDNMNNVAVTDGDQVEAEKVLGYHVDLLRNWRSCQSHGDRYRKRSQ